jgi:hypothetical protein
MLLSLPRLPAVCSTLQSANLPICQSANLPICQSLQYHDVHLTTTTIIGSLSFSDTIGWGCDIPWFWLLGIASVLAAITTVVVAVVPFHFYESMVPKVIVASLLLGTAGFSVFFVFKAVQETRYHTVLLYSSSHNGSPSTLR